MRVAVVGLGLIGGSLALAARAPGFDADPDVRAKARARSVEVAETLDDAVAGADVVVAAVPPGSLGEVLSHSASAAPRAVLTDVGSAKSHLEALATGLPAGIRVVGGHPLAGTTRPGLAAAHARLFEGRPWALVPTTRSDVASVAAVAALARSVGAIPLLLSAARHDALMTWLVRAPLVVAAALLRAAVREADPGVLARLAGPGFADTTRLAGTPQALIDELALADPGDLARALGEVVHELQAVIEALPADERPALAALHEAQALRDQFDRARLASTEK